MWSLLFIKRIFDGLSQPAVDAAVDEGKAQSISFFKKVGKSYWNARCEYLAKKRKANIQKYCTADTMVNALSLYYARPLQTKLREVQIQTAESRILTGVYSRPEYLNVGRGRLRCTIDDQPPGEPHLDDRFIAKGKLVKNQLLERGAKTWDAAKYRLLEIKVLGPMISANFSETTFYKYRYGPALLNDELQEALCQTKGDARKVVENKRTLLPLREALIPEAMNFEYLRDYPCCTCTGVLFAIAKKDRGDFEFIIQTRSDLVSDNPGFYATIPYGFHEPTGSSAEDVDLEFTVWRELNEELFNAKDAERANHSVHPEAALNLTEPLKWLRKNKKGYNCEILSPGYRATSCDCLFSVLFVIPDPEFWHKFGDQLARNWEAKKVKYISTQNRDEILAMLNHPLLVPDCRRTLAEGLIRLKELYPDRVADLDLKIVI